MPSLACTDCGHPVSVDLDRCPHCAQPGLFPNVRNAELAENRDALDKRYRAALVDAGARSCDDRVKEFERAAAASRAVIARPLTEIDRLAASNRELYATFYELRDVRLPADDPFNILRRAADETLFPGYKERIRFAALTLGWTGLSAYGECSLVLREPMIAHRASVFEENSAIALKRHNYEIPAGSRATWADRAKLCVAKLAGEISPDTRPEDFPTLLLEQGVSPPEDRFVEVHVWGPMTRCTFERVTVTSSRAGATPRRAVLKALRDRLAEVGVELEVQG